MLSRKAIVFAGLGRQYELVQKSFCDVHRIRPDYLFSPDTPDSLPLNLDCDVYIFSRRYDQIVRDVNKRSVNARFFLVVVSKTEYAPINLVHIKNSFKDFQVRNLESTTLLEGLKGRRAIVTGASGGLGSALAIMLAKHGCNLILQGRSCQKLERVQSDACRNLVEVDIFPVDFSNGEEITEWLSSIKHKNIDYIFNVAAISPEAIVEFSQDQTIFVETYMINCIAAERIISRFFPMMLHRNFGRIINISTNLQNNLWSLPYILSKAALDRLSFEVSLKCFGKNISCSTIDPGPIKTEMSRNQGSYFPAEVLPAFLLGALLPSSNGRHLNAEDFRGMSFFQAVEKYEMLYGNASD